MRYILTVKMRLHTGYVTSSKQSQDGTGFVTVCTDWLFCWAMTCGMSQRIFDVRNCVHLCFVLK
jgi:hypothetical protein